MLSRKDFIIETADRVRDSIMISTVVGKYLNLKRSGSSFTALCPFHNDQKLGSFFINDYKKVFKCFSCGEGGDVIKFVQQMTGNTYGECALNLALEHGIISLADFETYTSRKITKKESWEIEKVYIEKDKHKFKSNKADIETLDKVYRLFIKGFEYLNKDRLSQNDKKHLMEERELSEEEIQERGYFTFPDRHILNKFLKALEENNISIDVLQRVPGFFYDKKKESYSFVTYANGGIGIPIINENGKIEAIQVRLNVVKEGGQRYIWFSSAFAESKDNLEFGCGTGSPLDIIFPKMIKCQTIFITEGHFKAKKIANTYGCIVISVQGVCAWSKVEETIKNIQETYKPMGYNLKNIFVAYDADMSYNLAVFTQAIKMGLKLGGVDFYFDLKSTEKIEVEKKLSEVQKAQSNSENNKIYFVLWDDELGKGIDDLINNGNAHMIEKMKLETLFVKYVEMVKILFNKFPELKDNIDKVEKPIKRELFINLILNSLPKYKTA